MTAARRHRLWTAEQLFSRGLAATLVIVLGGWGYLVTRAAAARLTGSETAAAAAATALVALLFLPLYVHIQRLVDRLRYGRRPAPDSVLADITALSRSTPADAPNIARVAEAIGRGLGASSCRLTVLHPALQDRTYEWTDHRRSGRRRTRRAPDPAGWRGHRRDCGRPARRRWPARPAPSPTGGHRGQPRRHPPGEPAGDRARETTPGGARTRRGHRALPSTGCRGHGQRTANN
jgi:hypothetical protein